MKHLATNRFGRSLFSVVTSVVLIGGATTIGMIIPSTTAGATGITHRLAFSPRDHGPGYEQLARVAFTCNDTTGVISIKLTNVSPVLTDFNVDPPQYELWNTGVDGMPHVTVAITNNVTFDQATFELSIGQYPLTPAKNGLFGNNVLASLHHTVNDMYQGYVNGPWSNICQAGSEVDVADFSGTLQLTSTLK